jgi:hypothetical protein
MTDLLSFTNKDRLTVEYYIYAMQIVNQKKDIGKINKTKVKSSS